MATTEARAIVIHETGGPEVMHLETVAVGEPGPGEIRVRHEAVGLNFIDVYHRTGLYPLKLPHGLGMEAAGTVEAVGADVAHVKAGDRVAYAAQPPGAYAEARVMPAAQVCPLSEAIDFGTGAAMMLQGMTVEYLLHRVWPLKRGDTILFHAAAGGVGLIACQWAASEGFRLIGTAGGPEKCALAREHGAAEVIDYHAEDFVPRVRELTDGKGVAAVFDGVGKDTFEGSLDCIRPLGCMVSFGNASGPVPPFEIARLGQKGSLFVTRQTLFTHLADFDTCQEMGRHVANKVASGAVRIRIGQHWPLAEVADAHRALEARQTTGSTILTL